MHPVDRSVEESFKEGLSFTFEVKIVGRLQRVVCLKFNIPKRIQDFQVFTLISISTFRR